MKIALLLLRPHRRALYISVAMSILMGGLMGLDGKLLPATMIMVVVWAFILATLTGIQYRLLESPFPVTDKQLAWIPMGVWGLNFLAGMLAVMVVSALNSVQTVVPAREVFLAFLLAVMVGCYLVRFATLVIAFAPVLFLHTLRYLPQDQAYQLLPIHYWAPLVIIITIALICQAPLYASIWRRRDFGSADFVNIGTVDYDSPVRGNVWISLSNSIALAAVLVIFSTSGILGWLLGGNTLWENISNGNYWYLLALSGVTLACAGYLGQTVRRVNANGFTGWSFVWRFFLGISIVGMPFLTFTGVKSGAIMRCENCRKNRLAWTEQCAHCSGNAVAAKSRAPVWRRSFCLQDPARNVYRIVFPLLLLFFAGLAIYIRMY